MVYLNPTARARIEAHRQFKCIECGNCCRECGPITLNERDIKRLAGYFRKKEEVVIRRHCKTIIVQNHPMLSFKHDRPCKFYDSKKGCKIYEARPDQCRLHPFLSGENVFYDGIFMVPIHCEPAVEIYEKMKEHKLVTRDGTIIDGPDFNRMVKALTKKREQQERENETCNGAGGGGGGGGGNTGDKDD